MRKSRKKGRRSARRHDRKILKTLTQFAANRATSDNQVTIYHRRSSLTSKMLNDIRNAKRRIFLEIHEMTGEIGWLFARALALRAEDGLDVRVIYDPVGCYGTVDLFEHMREHKVKVLEYRPIDYFDLWRKAELETGRSINLWRFFCFFLGNLLRVTHSESRAIAWDFIRYLPNNVFRCFHLWERNHRKSLIIDGRIVYNGSFNICDCEAASGDTEQWRDTHARVEGSAAKDTEILFADTWLAETGENIPDTEFPRPKEKADRQNGQGVSIHVLRERSKVHGRSAKHMYLSHFGDARDSIRLNGPYFLPTRKILHALYAAVRRKVEVVILMPQKSDMPRVHQATRWLIARLLRNGISVYLYQPSMLHSKILVVDGIWSILGTSNLDVLSIYHNLEVDYAFDDESIGRLLTEQFDFDLERSKKLTLEEWEQDPSRNRWQEWRWYILFKGLQILGSWK